MFSKNDSSTITCSVDRPFLKVTMAKKKPDVCNDDIDLEPFRSFRVKHRLTNDLTIKAIKHFYSKKMANIPIQDYIRVEAGNICNFT
jgi:hypothetical protein